HAQAIGIAPPAGLGEALIAARLATPAQVEAQRRRWFTDLPETPESSLPYRPDGASRVAWAWTATRTLGTVSTHASLRSVWFRNSARGAVALAAPVAVAH